MHNAREELKYLISGVVKYGKLFVESDAGRNWEHLGTGDINSQRLPWWTIFYTDLKSSEFIDLTKKLLAYPVNNYQKGEILDEIKELFYKIKELDPANWNNTPIDKLKTSIATKPEVIEKFRKEFEYLVAQQVIDNYTWNKGEINDVIVISPVNGDFKAILLENYFSIIDHYENLEAKRIRELEEQLKAQEHIVLNLKTDINSNQVLSDKVEKLTDKNDELNVTKKKLEIENNLLTTQVQELKILLDRVHLKQKSSEDSKIQLLSDIERLQTENNKLRSENDSVYLLEDDLSDDIHNDMFALILMNELDLLQPRLWGDSTKEKIAYFIWNMLKISKKKKLTQSSIIRYRHILLNPKTNASVYKGWQKNYGERVAEVISRSLGNREVKINRSID